MKRLSPVRNGAGLPALVVAVLLSTLSGCSGNRGIAAPSRDARAMPRPPRFREVAGEAGIAFVTRPGGPSPLNIRNSLGHGAAFVDYDGDGRLDILLLNAERSALYRNEGSGRFVPSENAGADRLGFWHGIAVGDMDGDGDADLCLAGYQCLILLRNDRGRFSDVTAEAGVAVPGWGSSCGFDDLDGDGLPELIVAEYLEFGPASVQHCTLNGVKTVCDPKIYPPRYPRVYRNLRGHFHDVTREWGFETASGKALGIATGDFNGDGLADLAFANDQMPQNLFLRRRGGSAVRFRDEALDAGFAFLSNGLVHSGMGIDAADANGDGRPDLVVTNFQNEPLALYRNEGGTFTESSAAAGLADATFPLVGWGIRFADFDNDGDPDLLTANGHTQDNVAEFAAMSSYPQRTLLLVNDGSGRFSDAGSAAGEAFSRAIVGRAVAVGDYDDDGRVDALVSNLEGPPLLLHNETAHGGKWLGIEALAGSPPRPALGAEVAVETAARTQRRRVGALGSLFAAHDLRVHFGLGKDAAVRGVRIRWPDGAVESFPIAETDRYHRVLRGRGTRVAGPAFGVPSEPGRSGGR